MSTIQHIRQTESETLKFRLLTLVVIAVAIYFSQGYMDWLPAVGVVAGYLIYAEALHALVLPRINTSNIVYAMILVDAAAITAALHFFGGVESAIFVLYPISIVYYAIHQGYTTSIFTAVVMSFSYLGMAIYDGVAESATALLAAQMPSFFIIALFSGYLAHKRILERKERDELQELIRVEKGAKDLLEMTRTLSRSLTLQVVLSDIVTHLSRIDRGYNCVVALFDPNDGKLVAKICDFDLAKLELQSPEELMSGGAKDVATVRALKTREPVAIDCQKFENEVPAFARSVDATSLLVVPLQSESENLGALYLFETGRQRQFTSREIEVIRGYTELASNAIANALQYEQAQSRISQLVAELELAIQRLEHVREAKYKPEITMDGLRIDGAKEQAFLDNRMIELSPKEFEVLYLLAENAGTALNHETILRRIWGKDYQGPINVVDVTIHRLRKRMANAGAGDKIATIRGVGYMMPKTTKTS